jgi:2'-5' RNA ligase
MGRMPRLFVAAWPDAATCDALDALPRPGERDVRWVRPANWHVTLRFLGDVDAGEVIERCGEAEFPSAVARLGPAVERLDRRQIVVPVDGVDDVARAVRAATDGLGERARRPFRGHLTIARTKPDVASSVLGTAIDVTFDVDEIALVASDLTPNGAVYTTMATFPTRTPFNPRATRSR